MVSWARNAPLGWRESVEVPVRERVPECQAARLAAAAMTPTAMPILAVRLRIRLVERSLCRLVHSERTGPASSWWQDRGGGAITRLPLWRRSSRFGGAGALVFNAFFGEHHEESSSHPAEGELVERWRGAGRAVF
jgi:hypothetical protein